MLRLFLCLHHVYSALTMSFGLVALYCVALGFAIDGTVAQLGNGSFSWWLPATLVLSVLGGLLAWAGLSSLGVVPSNMAPWAFATSTLWLDKMCAAVPVWSPL